MGAQPKINAFKQTAFDLIKLMDKCFVVYAGDKTQKEFFRRIVKKESWKTKRLHHAVVQARDVETIEKCIVEILICFETIEKSYKMYNKIDANLTAQRGLHFQDETRYIFQARK